MVATVKRRGWTVPGGGTGGGGGGGDNEPAVLRGQSGKTYGVAYPSALATEDGSIKLAFAGETPLNAVPVTLVLDKDGRVAARLVGQIEDASILETIVRETLEES